MLDVRNEQLDAEERITGDPVRGIVRHDRWRALKFEEQLAALSRLTERWEQAHRDEIMEKFQERIRASTPEIDVHSMIEAQAARVLRATSKRVVSISTADSIGCEDEWAVDATNNVIEARLEACEPPADLPSLPCSSTKLERAWMRHERAKRPCLDVGPPQRMSPKELRDMARWKQKQMDQEVRQAGEAVTTKQQKAFGERRKIIEEPCPVWDHIRPCPSRMPRCFETVVT